MDEQGEEKKMARRRGGGDEYPGYELPGQLQETIASIIGYANTEEERILLAALRHNWMWQLDPTERAVLDAVRLRVSSAQRR